MSYDELRTKVRPEQLQRTLAGIQLDRLLTAKVQDLTKPCGIWFSGPAGVGKSHDVRTYCKLAGIGMYEKAANKWWDGYANEEVVLLDDVHTDDKGWLAKFLKLWSDAYAFKAETKGGMLNIRPQHFIVTSNYDITDFAIHEEDRPALLRRFKFHFVEHFNETFDALLQDIGPVVIPPTPEDQAPECLEELPSDLPMIDDPPTNRLIRLKT